AQGGELELLGALGAGAVVFQKNQRALAVALIQGCKAGLDFGAAGGKGRQLQPGIGLPALMESQQLGADAERLAWRERPLWLMAAEQTDGRGVDQLDASGRIDDQNAG